MRLGPIPKRGFRRMLLDLGFVEERGKDHACFDFYYEGKIVAHTEMSRSGGKEIPGSLLAYILRRQIFLSREEFAQARARKLGKEDYVAILTRKGLLN